MLARALRLHWALAYLLMLNGALYLLGLIAGVLAVLSGWAMHKPVQLGLLERMFVNYDGARLVHLACTIVLGARLCPGNDVLENSPRGEFKAPSFHPPRGG